MDDAVLPPKVFVSYAHETDEHSETVLHFAGSLRNLGIDVGLDRYESNSNPSWPHWMLRKVQTANFVLMICSAAYLRRVMGCEQPGAGHGAHWEGKLIFQSIYDNPDDGSRFIPVLLPGCSRDYIPLPVRGHMCYAINRFEFDDPGFDALYRHLTSQPAAPAPPLGGIVAPPDLPRADIAFPGTIDKKCRKRIIDAICDLPYMTEPQRRDRIINELPRSFRDHIQSKRDPLLRPDVANIVDTCLHHKRGAVALKKALIMYYEDVIGMSTVAALIDITIKTNRSTAQDNGA